MTAHLSPEEFAWLREVYHEGLPCQRQAAFRAVLAHFADRLSA